MPTLKYRRIRDDTNETFKIANEIYDKEVTSGLLDFNETPLQENTVRS